MRYYFEPERLEGDNQYDWSKWKTHTDAVKSLTIREPPINLIISLKKFDINGAKIKKIIDYPSKFNLNDYFWRTRKRDSKTKNGNNYELYAVINHEGSYSHWGHYNCYVLACDQCWYRWDDSKIKKITDENQKSLEKAYILFYRLVKPTENSPVNKPLAAAKVVMDEETKTMKSAQLNSNSKNNRKRRKTTPPVKSKQWKDTKSKEVGKENIRKISWGMSEVCKSTSSGPKRFKKDETEVFDVSAGISI